MKLRVNIIFIHIVLILTSCTNKNCPSYVEIPAFLTPSQIEYHIGDTIKISSKFYKDLILLDSEEKELEKVDMSQVEWKPLTVIFRTDTLDQAGLSTINKYFSFIENVNYDYKMYFITSDVSALEGEYNFKNDTFDLQIILVTKKIGTYYLKQTSNTARDGQQKFSGKCPGDNVDAWVNMNNQHDVNDNNIGLLTESPDTHFNTCVLSNPNTNFHHFGGYCFRVVP